MSKVRCLEPLTVIERDRIILLIKLSALQFVKCGFHPLVEALISKEKCTFLFEMVFGNVDILSDLQLTLIHEALEGSGVIEYRDEVSISDEDIQNGFAIDQVAINKFRSADISYRTFLAAEDNLRLQLLLFKVETSLRTLIKGDLYDYDNHFKFRCCIYNKKDSKGLHLVIRELYPLTENGLKADGFEFSASQFLERLLIIKAYTQQVGIDLMSIVLSNIHMGSEFIACIEDALSDNEIKILKSETSLMS